MKPLLHPSCFISSFFFAALLMISINTQTCLCDDDHQYTNCNTAFSCESSSNSNVSDLKYPFWGENRDKHCGSVPNPNMELTCDDNNDVPKITINEVKYRILDWDNTTQVLRVARDDYWDNICDVSNTDSYKNSTFGNTLFQRESDAFNVTLLYNCVSNGNPPNDIFSNDCGNNGNVFAVLDSTSYSFFCTSSIIVVIPLLGSQASSLVSQGRVTDALKEGFDLRRSENTFDEECGRCVDSEGVCGNDGGNGFRCFCKDGPHTTTCNSKRVSSM